MKNEPILTQEQQKLATAKEKISEALLEINTELKTISDYLPKVGKVQKLEFIGDLVNVQEQLEKYMDEAQTELNNYSTIRKELVSFADREDIFFIPKLLNPTRDYARTIVSVLKNSQEELFQHPDTTSEQEVEDVVYLHVFFKRYVKTLEQMWKVYEDLYDAVYACDKAEYEKRFNMQYESFVARKSCKVTALLDLHDSLFNLVGNLLDDEYSEYYDHIDEYHVDQSSANTNRKRASSLFSKVYSKTAEIFGLQDVIGRRMQQIVPDISKEEFTTKTHLANYIHVHKLEHHEVNLLMAGYFRLHLLEQLSQLVAPHAARKRAPGRKVFEFSTDFDYDMLSKVFTNTYETEKVNINAGSKNVFAGLFLIAMHNMNVYLVNGKVQAFCKLIKKLCGWKLCVKSVQDLITQCSNYLYNKITNPISFNRLKKYMQVAERLSSQLVQINLIMA